MAGVQIRDRVFGAPVDKKTRIFFDNLQKGVFEIPTPNESVATSQYNRDYLGDSTPFVRMWSAIQISGSRGSEIKYFVINDNNQKSYEPNDSIDASRNFQLSQGNPYLKPAAGVTSLTTKTMGALGVIKSTSVDFMVHNFKDFQDIFLPYFLRPGARIIIDYGWTFPGDPNPLYDLKDIVDDSDEELSKFYTKVYGQTNEKGKVTPGWVNQDIRKGLVNTVFGEVVTYDVTQTEEAWQCSLEIKSSNTPLLETEITEDNDLKFVFGNQMEETIAASLLKQTDTEYQDFIKDMDILSAQQNASLMEKFFEGAGFGGYGTVKGDSSSVLQFGAIPLKSLETGVFYHDIGREHGGREKESLYISYGRFEDLFLNNLYISKGNENKSHPLEVSFNSLESYVRYEENLATLQTRGLMPGEKLPDYIYPITNPSKKGENFSWFRRKGKTDFPSYNTKKMQKMGYTISSGGNYPVNVGQVVEKIGYKAIPLRELFISCNLIGEAFSTKNSINEALIYIWDSINKDSYNVFNIQMLPNNDGHSNISFHDLNLLPTKQVSDFDVHPYDIYEFDVTSGNSVVSNLDLKFTMPKAGLGSMIAIQSLSSGNMFDVKSLDRLNLLKVVDSDRYDENVTIRSLPSKNTKDDLGDVVSKVNFNYDVVRKGFNPTGQSPVNIGRYGAEGFQGKVDSYLSKFQSVINAQKKENRKETIVDENSSENIEKAKEGIKNKWYGSTPRDAIGKKARRAMFNDNKEDSVAPILPIEMSLTIYGNELLSIGDFITINFLPKQYKDRSFFQIVGIEHRITPEGWDTTYSLIFRVIPKAKGNILKEVKKTESGNDSVTLSPSAIETIVQNESGGEVSDAVVDLIVEDDVQYIPADEVITWRDPKYPETSKSRQVHWDKILLNKKDGSKLDLSDKVQLLTFPPPKNQNDLCFTYAFTHEFHKLVTGDTPMSYLDDKGFVEYFPHLGEGKSQFNIENLKQETQGLTSSPVFVDTFANNDTKENQVAAYFRYQRDGVKDDWTFDLTGEYSVFTAETEKLPYFQNSIYEYLDYVIRSEGVGGFQDSGVNHLFEVIPYHWSDFKLLTAAKYRKAGYRRYLEQWSKDFDSLLRNDQNVKNQLITDELISNSSPSYLKKRQIGSVIDQIAFPLVNKQNQMYDQFIFTPSSVFGDSSWGNLSCKTISMTSQLFEKTGQSFPNFLKNLIERYEEYKLTAQRMHKVSTITSEIEAFEGTLEQAPTQTEGA